MDRIESIRAKLERAAERNLRPFGVERHNFISLPAVPSEGLNAFEEQYSVVLPAEYRQFLAHVSRGGAGPAYGLIPFRRSLPADCDARLLATPFPFENAHVPEPPTTTGDPLDNAGPREISGTLALCDEGCGYVHFLVCSGSTRGQIWIDNTVSDGGYSPLKVGFFDWYERWLDNVLAGGQGTWWLRSPDDDEPTFQNALRKVKPWWRR